jgi:hypothetical protein
VIKLMIRLAVACSLVAVACHRGPADGKSCDNQTDSVICLDSETRLSCEDSTWHAESCLGPKGCEAGPLFVSCDSSVANEDSRCGKADDLSCTLDKKSMLRCKAAKWLLASKCLGPKGCEAGGFFVACDTSIVVEGDVCDNGTDGKRISAGCSADKKTRMACKDNRWKRDETCLGPAGCHQGLGVKCDGPTASPGEFCVKGERDDYACSPDGKRMLECEADGWKVSRACRGPAGCSSSALGVECDDSVQDPDSPCDHEGAAACSTDGKTILVCKRGKLATKRTCPTACKTGFAIVSCE